MALSARERARRWRQRHPDAARAHLDTVKGHYPRRRKKVALAPVMPPLEAEQDGGSVTEPEESITAATAPVTAPGEQEQQPPAPPALDPRTVVSALVDELADIAERLKQPGL